MGDLYLSLLPVREAESSIPARPAGFAGQRVHYDGRGFDFGGKYDFSGFEIAAWDYYAKGSGTTGLFVISGIRPRSSATPASPTAASRRSPTSRQHTSSASTTAQPAGLADGEVNPHAGAHERQVHSRRLRPADPEPDAGGGGHAHDRSTRLATRTRAPTATSAHSFRSDREQARAASLSAARHPTGRAIPARSVRALGPACAVLTSATSLSSLRGHSQRRHVDRRAGRLTGRRAARLLHGHRDLRRVRQRLLLGSGQLALCRAADRQQAQRDRLAAGRQRPQLIVTIRWWARAAGLYARSTRPLRG